MKKYLPVFLIGFMLILNSCSRKVVYVKDMSAGATYDAMEAPSLRIQKSDRLSIVVSSKMPELAMPFNQDFGNYQVNDQGQVSTTSSAGLVTKGYLVDNKGEIDFPILGQLRIEGMTLDQLKNMIKRRLIDGKLINDPIINVELLNFKINMMGEIQNVGVLNVPDAKITILDAISRSGGLTINAAVDKITVIREEDGVRKVVVNDIRSKDIFNSPTYYLQQNDIVYIEPRDAVLTPKAQESWRYVTTGIGLLGTIFSILTFLK